MKRKNVANELVAAMREAAAIAQGEAEPAAAHSLCDIHGPEGPCSLRFRNWALALSFGARIRSH